MEENLGYKCIHDKRKISKVNQSMHDTEHTGRCWACHKKLVDNKCPDNNCNSP